MKLTYKNHLIDEVMKRSRNIRYANGNMLFGFNNTIELPVNFSVDLFQISIQADIFSRQIMTMRSDFDLKRILGPRDQDWQQMLHHAYVYDRVKAIYYGLMSNNRMTFPDDTWMFPGHVILANFLSRRQLQFHVTDEQPCSLYVTLNVAKDIETILKEIFEQYPKLEQGISQSPNHVSYVNTKYESILKGLHNAIVYINGVNKRQKQNDENGVNDNIQQSNESLYELIKMNDSMGPNSLTRTNCAVVNSSLNDDGDKFHFVIPSHSSKPQAIRFDESVFIGRAIGIRSNGLNIEGNEMYNVVPRNMINDQFTRDELYAITGMKTEMVPLSMEQIIDYLTFDSYDAEYDCNQGLRSQTLNKDKNRKPLP